MGGFESCLGGELSKRTDCKIKEQEGGDFGGLQGGCLKTFEYPVRGPSKSAVLTITKTGSSTI